MFVAVLHNLAQNYKNSGRLEKAIEMCEQVVEIETADTETNPLSFSACKYATLGVGNWFWLSTLL